MAIAENDTDLRGSSTLAGQLADVVDDGVGRALEPGGHAARVGDRRGGNTLALAVKATHFGGVEGLLSTRLKCWRWRRVLDEVLLNSFVQQLRNLGKCQGASHVWTSAIWTSFKVDAARFSTHLQYNLAVSDPELLSDLS